MTRVRRVLAAFLLVAPAGAQIARLPAVEPTLAAPAAAVPPISGAAFASPASFAPALTPFSAAAAPLAAPAAIPAAAARADAAAPTLAATALSAADGGTNRRTPPTAAAPAAASADAGRGLFDGARELRTRSGSVFVPSFASDHARFPGGFAFVLSRPSPVARVKAIQNTQGLTGERLLARVASIAARGQRLDVSRASASQFLFSAADNHTLGTAHGVTDAYSGVFIPGTSADAHDYSENGDAAREGWPRAQVMNVEHVFPQSLFHGQSPMRADLHHLMATLEHPNNVRGNLPFGVVEDSPDYGNAAGAKRGGGFFEPPDFSKGRVARAMLYFYARYRGEPFFDANAARFWNLQIATLLDWNRRFPPTVEERRRNDQVEGFQGNRNPFVDDYSLADKIGLDAWRAPAPRSVSASKASSRRSDKPRRGEPRKAQPRRSSRRPQKSGFSRR